VSAFDAHRVGKIDYLWSPNHPDGRRCLSPAELSEKGFRTDMYGRWRSPRRGTPPWKADVTPNNAANIEVEPQTPPEHLGPLDAVHQGSDEAFVTVAPGMPTGVGVTP
jgi:hypothetical protein